MRTDSELQKDVQDELAWEPSVAASDIGVSVKSGVVTLNGTVPTYAEKRAAENAARRVPGVTAVAEEIKVTPIGPHLRSDSEIADAAARALRGHVWVPSQVQATVQGGWITLSGQVTWRFEKNSAEEAVRYLPGVLGVVVVGGQRFMGYNGGPYFSFSQGFSLFVDCEDQAEVDAYWDKLVEAGATPSQCGWITDQFGVTWQIVPRRFMELINDSNGKKVQAVMEAMLKMVKLDVAVLEKAYRDA